MLTKAELKNYTVIKGYILIKSGLHIGGNKDSMQIGGIDNPVIKNPITNLPYIPGSSLKGKMRFLLEHYYGLVKTGEIPDVRKKGSNSDWEKNLVAVMFGHMEKESTYPTRVIFRDGNLVGAIEPNQPETEASINFDIEALKRKMNADFVEAKTEVGIDRLSGTANRHGPRTIERVPAGTVFDFEVSLRLYKEEDESIFLPILKKGLQLLENDALGGSGSRGSGRIKFLNLKLDGKDLNLKDAE